MMKAWAITKNGEVISNFVRTSRDDAKFEAAFFRRHNRSLGGTDRYGIRAFEIVTKVMKRPRR